MFRIDLKGVYSKFERQSIEMSKTVSVAGIQCKLDDPSNMIVHKIYFGSEQDYEDAIAVYIRNKEGLNIDYMRNKATELKILEKFESFLKEVENSLNTI